MNKKEKIYDEQISPLMKQIIEICKEHKIPLFSIFGFDPISPEEKIEVQDDPSLSYDCKTILIGEEYGNHCMFNHLVAISECRCGDGINIDRYLMGVERKAREDGSHSSAYLSMMGISPETGKRKEESNGN